MAKDHVRVTTAYPGHMRTGSPRNVDFKGNHRAEYTWFLLSDSLPGFSINADRAARQIIVAYEYGRSQLIVSIPAKLAITAHALFPGAASLALRWANQVLPVSGQAAAGAKKGGQSTTRLTESWLTTLDQEAAKKNNQVPKTLSR